MAKISAPLPSPPVRNRLLAALLPADFALLQPHLRPVVLPLKKEIECFRDLHLQFTADFGVSKEVSAIAETSVVIFA